MNVQIIAYIGDAEIEIECEALSIPDKIDVNINDLKVGDRIEVSGVEGVVKEVGARRTTVVTPDQIASTTSSADWIGIRTG